MQPRTTKMQRAFSVFILAGLVLTAACSKNQDLSILPPDQSAAMQEIPALKKQPASTTTAALPDAGRKSETPCTASACPSLVVMQSGKPARIDVSSRGLLPAASLAIPKAQNSKWAVDHRHRHVFSRWEMGRLHQHWHRNRWTGAAAKSADRGMDQSTPDRKCPPARRAVSTPGKLLVGCNRLVPRQRPTDDRAVRP